MEMGVVKGENKSAKVGRWYIQQSTRAGCGGGRQWGGGTVEGR